jgi:Lar family restriction alleviation protein
MAKLKPCPFCGGKAHVMQMGFPHWVYCEDCGAKVQGGTCEEKDSIKAWNRRTGSKLEQELILDKIRAEISEIHLIGYATVDGKREIARRAVMQIINKIREEARDKE